jgi:opacity protein-like surface antigen
MSDSTLTLTGVLMAGLGFGLTDSVVLSVGYRLQGIATQDGSRTRATNNDSSAKKSGETLDVLLIHSGIVGISYKF